MTHLIRPCPDCGPRDGVNRRDFLRATGAAALAAGALPTWALADEPAAAASQPETVVKLLYDSCSPEQRQAMCHEWDYVDPDRGLLRSRVENNWHINAHEINGEFYSDDQRAMIRHIFEGIYNPDWHKRIDKQLEDDAGGYGNEQNIAIFGRPGEDKFQFVMTGRHMTVRCDGNSAEHLAFGGPIFYGHAASGFDEAPDHPGNVFWPQAQAANKVFEMLDGRQRALALVSQRPHESEVAFQGTGGQFPGIPLAELTSDQVEQVQKTLQALVEPYRQGDRDEVVACLDAQGGLAGCSLAFYQDGDVGDDGVWDCWRLEGPAFVWYFRGAPHVHVWVNVASDPSPRLNANG